MTRQRNDRGMVTAETAMVLPVLLIVLCASLWGIAAAMAKLHCVDAAREAARAIARGEPDNVAQAQAQRAAPKNARVSVSRNSSYVQVAVQAPVTPLGHWLLPRLTVAATATTVQEPDE